MLLKHHGTSQKQMKLRLSKSLQYSFFESEHLFLKFSCAELKFEGVLIDVAQLKMFRLLTSLKP